MINIDDETYTLLKGKGKKNGKTYYTETFTFKSNETALFPNKKNKTFIEFEINNIAYLNPSEPKRTFEIVKGYIGNDFEKHEGSRENLGTFLLEVMNNYDLFMKTILYDYRNKLFDAKDDWRNKDKIIRNKYYKNDYNKYIIERQAIDIKLRKTLVSIFQQLLYKLVRINPKLGMLKNYVGQYVYEFFTEYPKGIEDLKGDINRIKKKYPNVSYKFANSLTEREQRQFNRLRHDIISLKRKNSIHYIFKRFCIFFSKLADEFRYGKKLIDNSFIYNGKRGKKFSSIETTLPTVKIEYDTENFNSPPPFKYTYEIQSLKDLFDTTIYQLSLSHRPIIKCLNCGKYFIPPIEFNEKAGKNKRTRDDKIYCNDKCKMQYRNRNRNKSKETVSELYNKLRKRYKASPIYAKELVKLKDLYDYCKSNQLTYEETYKKLTDFEEAVKLKYNVKRGRPPKRNKYV